jgi:hypothetical protein
MQRLIKRLLTSLWGATAWLRRPLVRKLDHSLTRICREGLAPGLAAQGEELRAHNDRLHETLLLIQAQLQGQNQALGEMSLALDSVIRELVRLRMQVEAMPLEEPGVSASPDAAEAA